MYLYRLFIKCQQHWIVQWILPEQHQEWKWKWFQAWTKYPGLQKSSKAFVPRNVDLYKSGRKHPHELLLINDDSQFFSSRKCWRKNKKHLSPCSDPMLPSASACTMNKLAWFSMCFLLRKSCSSVNLQCKSTPMYIVHFTNLPRVFTSTYHLYLRN